MKKIILGTIIVFIGFFFLLDNLGLISSSLYNLVISWQSLLMAIGAVILFDKNPRNKNAGKLLILVGAIFIIPKILDIRVSGIMIPLLIIALGIYFIIRAVVKKDKNKSFQESRHYQNFENMSFINSSVSDTGFIKREYVFTGSKERLTAGRIKGGEISAVFSGVELDFTQAELSDEVKNIHIKIQSVFSGVIIYVPEDWNIILQKTGVFGGFTDKRPQGMVKNASEKNIILELEAIFGGGEIKCYE